MNKNALRSIGAGVAGALVGIILSIGTDTLLRAAGIVPALGQSAFLLAAAYRTVYGVGAVYITARLAPTRPMMHAMVLGSLGLATNAVGAVVTWNSVPYFGPTGIPSRSSRLRLHLPGLVPSFA
jgi:hypothetical protein